MLSAAVATSNYITSTCTVHMCIIILLFRTSSQFEFHYIISTSVKLVPSYQTLVKSLWGGRSQPSRNNKRTGDLVQHLSTWFQQHFCHLLQDPDLQNRNQVQSHSDWKIFRLPDSVHPGVAAFGL